jgi:predicted membrane protein
LFHYNITNMKNRKFSSSNNDITAGVVILIIGSVLLLKALGFWFPGWFFSWPMIMVAVGFVVLVKNNFQSGFGFFMLLFGSFLLVKRELDLPMEIQPYLLPGGLILLGLFLILKQQNNKNKFNQDFFGQMNYRKDPTNPDTGAKQEPFGTYSGTDLGETINAQALFCGINRRVLSKNFKGGKTSAIFGGTEIDLTQADLSEVASLNVEVAFGGVKLIVPPHWDLQINVSNVFAGIEDKRMYPNSPTDPNKVLKIYGSIIFGGLEIKSF